SLSRVVLTSIAGSDPRSPHCAPVDRGPSSGSTERKGAGGMFCPGCGLEQPTAHRFCARCGRRLPSELLGPPGPKLSRWFRSLPIRRADPPDATLRVTRYLEEVTIETAEGSVR